MPLETEYADDTSFSNSRKEPLDDLYPVCKAVFSGISVSTTAKLKVCNYTKLCHAARPKNRKIIDPGIEYRGDEAWRKHKVCSDHDEDSKKKCILCKVAYANSSLQEWRKHKVYIYNRPCVFSTFHYSLSVFNLCNDFPLQLLSSLQQSIYTLCSDEDSKRNVSCVTLLWMLTSRMFLRMTL